MGNHVKSLNSSVFWVYDSYMNSDQYYIKQIEPYFPGEDKVILDKLLEHAAYLYKSLYRYSGESYLTRALRLTSDKILQINPDRTMIVSSVLLSACYSPRCDIQKIEELFGKEVRTVVESLGKINSIKSRYSSSDTKVISNMFLKFAQDIRVILIRLADRIENMETLQFKSPEKQKANAKEILDVYVPIANKLGLYEYKLVLEDMAFKYVFPEEYDVLKADLDEYLGATRKTIDDAKYELENILFRNGFKVRVSGRVKNLFSIYKKLKKKTRSLDEIFDIYALRVILESKNNLDMQNQAEIEQLYKILSTLHSKYDALPDRFKDYVSNPKPNGYRSLHTAVVGLNTRDNKPTEIQIRTNAMHHFAEHGFAAHWMYKENNQSGTEDEALVKALGDLKTSLETVDKSTAELKMNLYPDRIFVLTPENLVRELPIGSTPVDFAFSIHSDIGFRCNLARVNGSVVSLDYELKNGEIVEIVTSPKINAKLSWLEFVKTKQARSKIKSHFRAFNRQGDYSQGKEELNTLLEKLDMPLLDDNLSFLKTYKGKNLSFKARELLLEDIGRGIIAPSLVFRNVTGKSFETYLRPSRDHKSESLKFKKTLPTLTQTKSGGNGSLLIGGEKNMPYRLSCCCKPKLTDRIVGYITKNKGVSIHKVTCAFVKKAAPERLLEARLANAEVSDPSLNYHVSLLVEEAISDVPLKAIINYFNEKNITVLNYSVVEKGEGKVRKRLIIDIVDEEQLKTIISNLTSIEGVYSVSRM